MQNASEAIECLLMNFEFWMLNVELFSAKACDCELVNCELYHELIGDDSQLPLRGAVVASKGIGMFIPHTDSS